MSILLVMWAAKQTKKGVHKADVAIKRRSQMRYEKRMTKLGMNVQHFSSLPDLAEEDPFADPVQHEHEQEWQSLELPNKDTMSNLPPEAAEAVARFVALENQSRKSYHAERRRSLDSSRSNSDFPAALRINAQKEVDRRKTAAPSNNPEIPGNEKTPGRSSLSDTTSENLRRTTFNFKELQDRKKSVIENLGPHPSVKSHHRPGANLLRRMSTWRGSKMPRSRMVGAAEADF